MGSPTTAARLPVFSPAGEPVEMKDPTGLVLCRNCGMCRTWATRPHLPTPCVSAHQLVDGTMLLHWTLERLGQILRPYINDIASAERAEYPAISDRFESQVEDLLAEMVVRFSQRAELWHSRAVTVMHEVVEARLRRNGEEGRADV